MTKTRLIPTVMLIAGLLAACSASATPTQIPAQDVIPQPTGTLPPSVVPTLDQSFQPTAAPTAIPIATSRGPELEATDPTTVNMASGGLQFVEFFEFW
jgi:hypothetical protein